MIFRQIELLSIIKPIWYYDLKTNTDRFFIDWESASEEDKKNIDVFKDYDSTAIMNLDIAYQAWHKGYIGNPNKNYSALLSNQKICLEDQYKFIRRMFKPIWIYYTIFIRVVTLNNPFYELKVFFKTRKIKQIDLNFPNYAYQKYITYKAQILITQPLVSVVIPTLNRYEVLKNALTDLSAQDYKNFEVIIVDQSEPFNEQFYEIFDMNIKLIRQRDRYLWKARNNAIKTAKGKYILLFDDDSRIDPNWISEHLKCIEYFKADISAGVSISQIGAPIPEHYKYFRWSDQLDTGNALIKKEVFKKSGLFDRMFEKMRMGDGEFGARVYKDGFNSINNPNAKRIHLKFHSGGLREIGSWDSLHPTSILSPRPIPSVLYFFRKYWGKKRTLFFLIQNLPLSIGPFRMKGTKLGYIISFINFLLFTPLVIIQVIRSWKISSKMLVDGNLIEKYK